MVEGGVCNHPIKSKSSRKVVKKEYVSKLNKSKANNQNEDSLNEETFTEQLNKSQTSNPKTPLKEGKEPLLKDIKSINNTMPTSIRNNPIKADTKRKTFPRSTRPEISAGFVPFTNKEEKVGINEKEKSLEKTTDKDKNIDKIIEINSVEVEEEKDPNPKDPKKAAVKKNQGPMNTRKKNTINTINPNTNNMKTHNKVRILSNGVGNVNISRKHEDGGGEHIYKMREILGKLGEYIQNERDLGLCTNTVQELFQYTNMFKQLETDIAIYIHNEHSSMSTQEVGDDATPIHGVLSSVTNNNINTISDPDPVQVSNEESKRRAKKKGSMSQGGTARKVKQSHSNSQSVLGEKSASGGAVHVHEILGGTGTTRKYDTLKEIATDGDAAIVPQYTNNILEQSPPYAMTNNSPPYKLQDELTDQVMELYEDDAAYEEICIQIEQAKEEEKRSKSAVSSRKIPQPELMMKMHNKLREYQLNPFQERKSTIQRQREAEERREKAEKDKLQLAKKNKERQQTVRERQAELEEERKGKMMETKKKLDNADVRYERHLNNIRARAKIETEKLDEVALLEFLINTNKKLDYDNKFSESKVRRDNLHDLQKQKLSEKKQHVEETVEKLKQSREEEAKRLQLQTQSKAESAEKRRNELLKMKLKTAEEDSIKTAQAISRKKQQEDERVNLLDLMKSVDQDVFREYMESSSNMVLPKFNNYIWWENAEYKRLSRKERIIHNLKRDQKVLNELLGNSFPGSGVQSTTMNNINNINNEEDNYNSSSSDSDPEPRTNERRTDPRFKSYAFLPAVQEENEEDEKQRALELERQGSNYTKDKEHSTPGRKAKKKKRKKKNNVGTGAGAGTGTGAKNLVGGPGGRGPVPAPHPGPQGEGECAGGEEESKIPKNTMTTMSVPKLVTKLDMDKIRRRIVFFKRDKNKFFNQKLIANLVEDRDSVDDLTVLFGGGSDGIGTGTGTGIGTGIGAGSNCKHSTHQEEEKKAAIEKSSSISLSSPLPSDSNTTTTTITTTTTPSNNIEGSKALNKDPQPKRKGGIARTKMIAQKSFGIKGKHKSTEMADRERELKLQKEKKDKREKEEEKKLKVQMEKEARDKRNSYLQGELLDKLSARMKDSSEKDLVIILQGEDIFNFLETNQIWEYWCHQCNKIITWEVKEHYNMEHQPENNMDIHDIYHIQTMPIEDINLINMKIKLLKKKARKTKNNLNLSAIQHENYSCITQVRDLNSSINKMRLLKLCVDLEKQLIPHVKNYETTHSILREIIKILELRKEGDLHLLRQLKFLPSFTDIWRQTTYCVQKDVKYYAQLLDLIVNILYKFITLRENRIYLLVTNRLISLVDLLIWCLVKTPKFIFGITFIPHLLHIFTVTIKQRLPFEYLKFKEEFISYIICSNLLSKITNKIYNSVNGPLDLSEMGSLPSLILYSMTFIEAITTYMSKDAQYRPVYEKGDSRTEDIVFVITQTEGFGIVPLLSTILLSKGQLRAKSYVLPQTIFSLVLMSLKVLNNIFRVDLHVAQSLTGKVYFREQMFHLLHYLLRYSLNTLEMCPDSKELLNETVLICGYFGLGNTQNQEIVCKGNDPIIKQLSNLPIEYFFDEKTQDVLLPTLIVLGFQHDRSAEIMKEEMNMSILCKYLEGEGKKDSKQEELTNSVKERAPSMQSNTSSSTYEFNLIGNPSSPFYKLSKRFPNRLWKEAILYFRDLDQKKPAH